METFPPTFEYSVLTWFKSYYVVWKLFGFSATNRASAVFKSYYVVWKPIFHHSLRLVQTSLNRTM